MALNEQTKEKILQDYLDTLNYEKKNGNYNGNNQYFELSILYRIVFRNIVTPVQNIIKIFEFLTIDSDVKEVNFEDKRSIKIDKLQYYKKLVDHFWELNKKYNLLDLQLIEPEYMGKNRGSYQ